MKIRTLELTVLFVCLFALRAAGTTYYVDINSTDPTPPYISWSSAATNIQDAISETTNGDLVLVNPGVYQNGGATAPDQSFYRLVITNAITVESVDGPATIYISGNVYSSYANCAYLTNGATLSGFTVTNSVKIDSYGQISAVSTNAVITNCTIAWVTVHSGTLNNCTAGSSGCDNSTLNNCLLIASSESVNSTMNNCVISNNANVLGGVLNNCSLVNFSNPASYEDPANAAAGYPLVLNNCIISNNTSEYGGGVYNSFSGTSTYYTNCILNNCILTRNSAQYNGGGAYNAELNNCLISSNQCQETANGAVDGGLLVNCTLIGNSSIGAYNATLTNCTLVANTNSGALSCTLNQCTLSQNVGGGAGSCTLNQCTLSQNLGIGATSSTLNSCLLISNSPPSQGPFATTGGGAYNCTLTNCIIAYNIATNGGGAYGSTLVNCAIVSNSAISGGGAYESTLVNCTVISNTAVTAHGISSSGGIFNSTAQNCIIYYNNGGDYATTAQYPLNYCCTPVPANNGIRNITNAPLFVNLAGGDYHLQSSSPCINSGNNAYVNSATDLDGNPRIAGGTVDIGAYEYQTPTSVISYAYLQQYGLPTDGSVDFTNLDGTAFNVYQDWIAGLNPTNPASVLAMQTPAATNNTSGIKVTWKSVSGVTYFLQRSTNLTSQPPFSTIQNNITGQSGTTSYTDTSATNNVPYFYRVGVIAP